LLIGREGAAPATLLKFPGEVLFLVGVYISFFVGFKPKFDVLSLLESFL